MAEFKVGDRVRLTEQYDYLEAGEEGTVVEVFADDMRVKYDNDRDTDFDRAFREFAPEWGKGWLTYPEEVEHV